MRTTPILLASLLCAVVVPAQADPQPQTAGAEFERLTAEWQAAQADYRAAYQAAGNTAEFLAAADARDRAKMRALLDAVPKPDAAAFGARAMALAGRSDGEDRMRVLVWLTNECGDGDSTAQAIALVRDHHLDSPQLADLMENAMRLQRVLGPGEGEAFLDEVLAKSSQPLPKAWAMYWQAVMLERKKGADDTDKATAQRLLAEAEKLAEGTPLAERIAAPRFEQERLQIGMEAPDIVGEDVDGVAFKLSDYRGKVVVLDFWGFW